MKEEENEIAMQCKEDPDLAAWLECGMYGYVSPNDQFEFDDDLDKARATRPWVWYDLLAKWRPRIDWIWRRMKRHWLFSASLPTEGWEFHLRSDPFSQHV
jgi:hypothetical protein